MLMVMIDIMEEHGKEEDNSREDLYGDDSVDAGDLWGEHGLPEMREPDFSSVRRRIFSPWRIAIFLVVSILFWVAFFLLLQ